MADAPSGLRSVAHPAGRDWTPPTDDGPGPVESEQRWHHAVTLILGTVALVAVSGGVGWGLWRWWGPFAVAAAGGLLLVLVEGAEWARRPKPAPPAVPLTKPKPPGPEHPGPVHAKGG